MDKEIINYIEMDKLESYKKSLKNGEDRVILETENIKITLKKRGRKVYTFLDEFTKNDINKILQKVINLA